jgi:hypothetical protein
VAQLTSEGISTEWHKSFALVSMQGIPYLEARPTGDSVEAHLLYHLRQVLDWRDYLLIGYCLLEYDPDFAGVRSRAVPFPRVEVPDPAGRLLQERAPQITAGRFLDWLHRALPLQRHFQRIRNEREEELRAEDRATAGKATQVEASRQISFADFKQAIDAVPADGVPPDRSCPEGPASSKAEASDPGQNQTGSTRFFGTPRY